MENQDNWCAKKWDLILSKVMAIKLVGLGKWVHVPCTPARGVLSAVSLLIGQSDDESDE